EVASEFTLLDIAQDRSHLGFRLLSYNPRPSYIVTVLSRVADRVAHGCQSAFVDQVYDQLQFMQALEVSHLRRISGFCQSLKASFDQCADTAAKHSLFTEQVGFRLFAE